MGLFGSVQGLNIIMSLVRNKIVAVLLGTTGMGLITLYNSTVKLLSDSTSMGLPMSAVRELSAAYEQGDHKLLCHKIRIIRMWTLLTALIGMLLCMVLSPLLNRFTFAVGNHTLQFVFLAPTIAFIALAAGESAILKATRQLRALALQSVYRFFEFHIQDSKLRFSIYLKDVPIRKYLLHQYVKARQQALRAHF